MDKPISFSGYKRYVMCPKYYKFYDVDKDRPMLTTSALIVGSIMDEVVNGILLGEVSDPQLFLDLTTEAMFLDKDIEYSPDDFDPDLVDLFQIETQARSMGWKGKDITKAIRTFAESSSHLSKKQKSLLTLAMRQSLNVKMTAMLDGFMKWVYPQIKEVHEVQKHLTSKDGKVHGYLDFTCTLKDGRKVLFDLKTSKRAYDWDAVLKSPQLALYCDIEGYKYAGFIVLNKTLNKQKVKTCGPCGTKIQGGNAKKCPKCKKVMDVDMDPKSYVQMLVNEMPQSTKDLTRGAINDTIDGIDKKVFPRNLNQCFWMYGKECPYVNKCWRKK